MSLQLRMMGAPQVLSDGVALTFPRRKALALLAYLALTGRPSTREALAALVAGEAGTGETRTLRNELAVLNVLLSPHVTLDRHTVAITRSDQVTVDALAFVTEARRALSTRDPAAAARAVELYQGDLLDGFSLRDAPAFEEWMLMEREHYYSLLVETLALQFELACEQGEIELALIAGRRLIRLEPWRETVHFQLMGLLAALGRRAEAVAQFHQCEQVLAAELNVAPSAETLALYRRLRAEEHPVSAARSTPGAAARQELEALNPVRVQRLQQHLQAAFLASQHGEGSVAQQHLQAAIALTGASSAVAGGV